MAAIMKGLTLKKKGYVQSVTVKWKQGSFLGLGGDMSQPYNLYNYETPQGGLVPVYIQEGYQSPDTLICDGKIQYGMNDGVVFFVYHDTGKLKPYQHRFVQNVQQKILYTANELVKNHTGGLLDLSWMSGDYLRDI